MGRRRRNRGPDTEGLVRAIAGFVFLLVFGGALLLSGGDFRLFTPAFHAILSWLFTMAIIVVVGVVVVVILVLVIRSTTRKTVQQVPPGRPVTHRPEPEEPFVYLNPYENTAPTEFGLNEWETSERPILHERLKAIDWFQFEKLVSAIYEVPGCKVKRLGGAKADGGIDLLVENNGQQLIVQCKHWRNWTVGVRHIRELLGAMTDAKVETGVLVTLRGCTQDATEFEKKHNIHIVDEAELVKLMRMSDGSLDQRVIAILDDKRKFCPKCERPLVLRTATIGINRGQQFWGCSEYPRCRYILRNA
jgi:hypothetical protein